MKIKAFKGVRPPRDKAHLVASRSYLTYSDQALREKLSTNPYTFLHIINPEQSAANAPLVGQQKYKGVRDMYLKFRSDGVLLKDQKDSLYVYRQVSETDSYVGIIAASSVDDYAKGVIKVHEQTIASREVMFTDFLEHSGFNAEPVLITYSGVPRINEWIDSYVKTRPEYEFTTANKVLHHFWCVDSVAALEELIDLFGEVKTAYIADGHHRSASSMLYCTRKTSKSTSNNGDEPHHYFMSFLINDEQMRIFDYNRLILDINGLTTNEFLLQLKAHFTIQKQECVQKPTEQSEISMYFSGCWYGLKANDTICNPLGRVSSLGASLLSNHILSPILGIKDVRNDDRVAFLDGKKGLGGLQEAVDSGAYQVAFALKPVTVKQMKEVADRNEIMPPKSTYVEPKLRSGLVIYSLDHE